MSRPHVVVVGDVVLDRDVDGRTDRLCPDAPVPVLDVTARRESPGGAGLTALLVAASGARVTLVAPIADDDAARSLTDALTPHVDLVALGHAGPTRRKIRVRSGGQSLVRIDDGGPGSPTDVPADRLREVLTGADVVLVSDYGAGTTRDATVRALLTEAAAARPVVWDPHPRGGDPVPGTTLVTPNLAEARRVVADTPGAADAPADALAGTVRDVWAAQAVCVTAGATGAFLAAAGASPVFVPAPAVTGGDPCGAGDRFAATAAVVLARGGTAVTAVERAVADASAWVADGGAEGFRRRGPVRVATVPGEDPGIGENPGTSADDGAATDGAPFQPHGPHGPHEPLRPVAAEDLGQLGARLRAGGRTVVATGGCFDIVHAGHVATLQAARRLGDALVVLINSDDSVRRLKGPTRPVVTARDRARVLEAFDCVDAVVVFDEDDPRAALDRLRPDVWAKGGDYGGTELPEAAVVRQHGGRVVLLPYLGGRSTTSILERSTRPRTAWRPDPPERHRPTDTPDPHAGARPCAPDHERNTMTQSTTPTPSVTPASVTPASVTPREVGTVFITGGSSGLGAAVVDAVAAAGGTPAVLDRVPPRDGVAYVEVDLADSAATAAAVERLVAQVGPPSAVVTAGGTDACGPLLEIDPETWERVVRVNLFGTVAVVRAALPHLERVRGTVVTVGSTLSLRGMSDATAYSASKYGVRGFSHALAAELKGRVGVTLLIPGGMRTAFFDGRTEQYKPGPDADLNDPANTAATVVMALRQPVGSEIREMLVMASGESSWP